MFLAIVPIYPVEALAGYSSSRLRGRNNVGLGLGMGFQVPSSETPIAASGAWGFYTDIPLLRTFHISPSTVVYRLDYKDGSRNVSATDISMNFKFIVPLSRIDMMAGITAGLTSTQELTPHMGVVAGAAFKLVSNLHFFINANYRYILQGDGVIHDAQLVCGPLFKFSN